LTGVLQEVGAGKMARNFTLKKKKKFEIKIKIKITKNVRNKLSITNKLN